MGEIKDIREAVEAELAFDPLVDAADITVVNMNGDLGLNGTVPSYPQYLEALGTGDGGGAYRANRGGRAPRGIPACRASPPPAAPLRQASGLPPPTAQRPAVPGDAVGACNPRRPRNPGVPTARRNGGRPGDHPGQARARHDLRDTG
jgi:hypothetical protein